MVWTLITRINTNYFYCPEWRECANGPYWGHTKLFVAIGARRIRRRNRKKAHEGFVVGWTRIVRMIRMTICLGYPLDPWSFYNTKDSWWVEHELFLLSRMKRMFERNLLNWVGAKATLQRLPMKDTSIGCRCVFFQCKNKHKFSYGKIYCHI